MTIADGKVTTKGVQLIKNVFHSNKTASIICHAIISSYKIYNYNM
jgi:hypothetical protein